MAWDPSDLQLKSIVAPKSITTADTKVEILIEGAGFRGASVMFGTFVHSGKRLGGRCQIIPCNAIKLRGGDYWASLQICPRRKEPGKYDLLLWKVPPRSVVDKNLKTHPDTPVNDVAVLPDAIEIVDAGLPPLEDEIAEAKQNLASLLETGKLDEVVPDFKGLSDETK